MKKLFDIILHLSGFEAGKDKEDNDRISLFDVSLYLIWGWRLILISFLLLFGFCLVLISGLDPRYRAQIKILPEAETFDQGEFSVGASNPILSALGRRDDPESFSILREMMASPLLADRLIERHDALRRLIPDRWSEDEQAWTRPDSIGLSGYTSMVFGYRAWRVPDRYWLLSYIDERLSFEEDTETGAYLLAFADGTQERAVWLLTAILEESDELTREIQSRRAKRNLDFFTSAMERNTQTELREDFRRVILRWQRALALTETPGTVAYVGLGEVAADDDPYYPRPFLFTFAALFLSAFGAMALQLLCLAGCRYAYSREKEETVAENGDR